MLSAHGFPRPITYSKCCSSGSRIILMIIIGRWNTNPAKNSRRPAGPPGDPKDQQDHARNAFSQYWRASRDSQDQRETACPPNTGAFREHETLLPRGLRGIYRNTRNPFLSGTDVCESFVLVVSRWSFSCLLVVSWLSTGRCPLCSLWVVSPGCPGVVKV